MAMAAGIETWITSGYETDSLLRIAASQVLSGTKFTPRKTKFASRHAWIAFGRSPKGVLVIDEGAQKAVCQGRKSLLPSGIVSVRGQFSMGDTVKIQSKKGHEIGRGLVNYDMGDVRKILGHHSRDVTPLLGRAAAAEVIHRDNLVLL